MAAAGKIVRTPSEVHVYLPDRGVVLVEQRSDEGSLSKALPTPGPSSNTLYEMRVRDGNKLLGRKVRILDIRPRDTQRYGYRLWLDEETAMPLRTVVADGRGRPIELINFTQLDMPRSVDSKDIEPTVDASRLPLGTFSPPATGAAADVGRLEANATAAGVPPRRKPARRSFRAWRCRVQHLIFSDGVASISVFIEPGSPSGPTPSQASSAGLRPTHSRSSCTATSSLQSATCRWRRCATWPARSCLCRSRATAAKRVPLMETRARVVAVRDGRARIACDDRELAGPCAGSGRCALKWFSGGAGANA